VPIRPRHQFYCVGRQRGLITRPRIPRSGAFFGNSPCGEGISGARWTTGGRISSTSSPSYTAWARLVSMDMAKRAQTKARYNLPRAPAGELLGPEVRVIHAVLGPEVIARLGEQANRSVC